MMPQMQVFFVGVPLSILIGLAILLVVLGGMMANYLGFLTDVLHEVAPHV
jgi:flagellar biosynthetic protein FliR